MLSKAHSATSEQASDNTANKVLPPILEFSHPEGDISKKDADEYSPVFLDEYAVLMCILGSIQTEPVVRALQEEAFSKHFPDAGEFHVSYKTGLWQGVKDTVASIIPFSLRPYMFKLCDSCKSKNNTLGEVLGKSAWSYVTSVIIALLPLFVVSGREMFSPQIFLYKSCFQIPGQGNATSTTVFTQSCTSFPVDMYWRDYPSSPVASSDSCPGIASGISTMDFGFTFYQYYLIYVTLILMAGYFAFLETHEKIFIRVSAGLNGVFLPSSCTQYSHATIFAKSAIMVTKKSRGDTSQCCGVSADGIQNTTLSQHCCMVLWPARIVEALALWYLIAVCFPPMQLREWYVFPTKAAEVAFIDAIADDLTADMNFGWCGSLTRPMKLTYVKDSASSLGVSLLQAVIFLRTCYKVIETRKGIYDWMNGDEFMDHRHKDTCPYYNFHNYRNRVFSEPMLYDWIAVNLYYPVFHNILSNLSNSSHANLRRTLRKRGRAHDEVAKSALRSIYDKSTWKNGHAKESTGTNL